MRNYIIKRVLRMMPQLFLISVVAFIIIQLPPGDALDILIRRLESAGQSLDEQTIRAVRHFNGLDKPLPVQYLEWLHDIIFRFDFGYSFLWMRPVDEIIVGKMPLTFAIALCSALLTWAVAFPIAILAAVKQYSVAGYIFTILSFICMAVPPFLLAMVLMYVAYAKFGVRVGGLFSPEYLGKSWSWAKIVEMLKHLWLPIILVGAGWVPGVMRTLRATLLDELHQQYVLVARGKGLSELTVLLRYPLRLAISPIISGLMWLLPWLFSGGLLVEIVLNLPAAGPTMAAVLSSQDMYLAGSYILITGALTAVSSLLSDIVLGIVDPRIRIGRTEAA